MCFACVVWSLVACVRCSAQAFRHAVPFASIVSLCACLSNLQTWPCPLHAGGLDGVGYAIVSLSNPWMPSSWAFIWATEWRGAVLKHQLAQGRNLSITVAPQRLIRLTSELGYWPAAGCRVKAVASFALCDRVGGRSGRNRLFDSALRFAYAGRALPVSYTSYCGIEFACRVGQGRCGCQARIVYASPPGAPSASVGEGHAGRVRRASLRPAWH